MPRLSDPLMINRTMVRNRLVLPPLTNSYATAEGQVTEQTLGFYSQRARDVGILVVESTAVRPDGRIVPRSLGLWSNEHVGGMSRLAAAIKAQGAVAVVQINHAGASSVPVEGGIPGASPSGVATRPDVQPTTMSEAQIAEFTLDFVAAAARAREAGFDGVEIHAAHFYLLSQFLSPLTNLRKDRYGGDATARATFPVEVVKAVRERLDSEALLLVRMNSVELIDGGQTVEEAAIVARLLEKTGADAIDASLAATGAWNDVGGRRILQMSSRLPKEKPHGAAVEYEARVKTAVRIPVIGIGKLGAAEARRAVESGSLDMAAIGRQMIADPGAAGKILSGRDAEIVLCQECLTCMSSAVAKGQPLVCSTNRNPTGTPEFSRAPGI